MTNFRRWLNTEVTIEEAAMLKDFLDENEIEYEASEAYNLIHFEINVNEYEKEAINGFIDENF
jgi:hypothetical protein